MVLFPGSSEIGCGFLIISIDQKYVSLLRGSDTSEMGCNGSFAGAALDASNGYDH
jgi:hypothetical protein